METYLYLVVIYCRFNLLNLNVVADAEVIPRNAVFTVSFDKEIIEIWVNYTRRNTIIKTIEQHYYMNTSAGADISWCSLR